MYHICDSTRRLAVHAPKTERYEHGGDREVPLFPELRTALEDAWELAKPGDEFVITRYRDATQNLRTQFAKIIRRAGLKPWPKLFQNLRSTRETELAGQFPIHVVCQWIGNSQAVAAKHYLQVTDSDFEAAAKSDAAVARNEVNWAEATTDEIEKASENVVFVPKTHFNEWATLDSNQ